ncbi:MAG: hypothetical protein AB8H12_00065 [Lewinella sp.]
MSKLSTKYLGLLPSPAELKIICKAISALEAIICQDWEYRYYSYQSGWSETEELFEMRNGQGDQMLILFSEQGTCINGFAHESEMNGWKRAKQNQKKSFFQKLYGSREKLVQELPKGLVDDLPKVFNDFIFDEPIKSIGTTFCIWRTTTDQEWIMGNTPSFDNKYGNGSSYLLQLLDGSPMSYKRWAEDYYEEIDLNLEAIEKLYNQTVLTKELIISINPEIEDIESLKSDLQEIGYPNRL